MPSGRSNSPFAVWTHTTSAMGNPQNSAESPRASRPSEPSNSELGADSAIADAEAETGAGRRAEGVEVRSPFSIFHPPFLVGFSLYSLAPPPRLRLDRQVSVLLKPPLVVIEQAHAVGRFHLVGLDRLVDLRLHLTFQLVFVVLHGCQRLNDRAPFDDLL